MHRGKAALGMLCLVDGPCSPTLLAGILRAACLLALASSVAWQGAGAASAPVATKTYCWGECARGALLSSGKRSQPEDGTAYAPFLKPT